MSYYPARVTIDLAAIRHNAGVLAAAAPDSQLMAVVKADAYGHGLLPVARAALQGGAHWLGVAQLADAFALRAAGLDAPLLAWLSTPGAPFAQAVTASIDLAASASWTLDEIAAAARTTDQCAPVHLKIDTGMGRGGATAHAWEDLVGHAMRLQAEGVIRIVAIWSHLARADEPDHPANTAQLHAFNDAVALAKRHGLSPQMLHLANSAATLTAPRMHHDLVRPGVSLYGLSPAPQEFSSDEAGLIPAMQVDAEVMLVKDVGAGYPVSYGHTYITPTDRTLLTVPLGYSDGIPRHASNAAPVDVGGRRATIAGRVCMDQFVLDAGPEADVAPGDRAVLFGSGASGEPTAQDWAQAAGTINYEIVTRIASRIPRTYLNN